MVLNYYHDLSTGAQPEHPNDNNPECSKSRIAHGPYENPCMLAAEVARRVRRCGFDGYLVEERYGLNLMARPKQTEQIAAERGLPELDICKRINRVTWYCVGRKAKTETYCQWLRDKKYRRKLVIIR